MVTYNPNFPDALGTEFLADRGQTSRVWSGSPARWLRLPSTVAETISSLKLSATVDPLAHASIPTVIDVCPEGAEITAVPKVVQLAPNSDNVVSGWTDQAGGTTSLWQKIDEDSTRWPGPANDGAYIKSVVSGSEYACGVDASLFAVGGAAANGRIFFLGVTGILGANTGFRKIAVKLLIDGVLYDPAGGSIRDVNGFGGPFAFLFGELNPATGLPWVPADIARFDSETDWGIRVYAYGAVSDGQFPIVYALALSVAYLETENRVAVGVYRRPENVGNARLVNVSTDALVAVPAGTATWSKPASGNFLYGWRQSASPSLYGPTVGTDLRWNGLFQDLGPRGVPKDVVYPLQSTGDSPPPAGAICSQEIAYDVYGRPEAKFTGESRAAYALALIRSDAAASVDSQPYRLDIVDIVTVKQGAGVIAQRFTPASSQSYDGFRLPIIPPFAGATLTVTVNRVSDGVQMGGSYSTTAGDVGALPYAQGGIRYLSGFLSSAASLVGGTQYEVRLASTLTGAGQDTWMIFGLDASLAPTAGFGSTTDGAVIGGVHQTGRDLAINLIKAPSPPTNCVASITTVPVTTPYLAGQVPSRQVVTVTWTAPASGMGAKFLRYELEHSMDGGPWERVANITNAAVTSFVHRSAPYKTASSYRIRAVGKEGRVSGYATSGSVTPQLSGLVLVLTSDHDSSLETVYFYEKESSYLILSDEGTEMVRIHGADNQVAFLEREDRGVGWQVDVWVHQSALVGKGGEHVLTPLLAMVRSLTVPYVVVLDGQGSRFMAHVAVAEVPQMQPANRYKAQLTVTPTHSEPVPVEVS